MNERLWKQAEIEADREYEVRTQLDVLERVVIAWCPDLPGCMAHGQTHQEAAKNLRAVRIEWLYAQLCEKEKRA